jgi:Tol biopolymer transport system component
MSTGNWNIYVVGVDDRRVRPVTSDTAANIRPSWSSDGKWIYFGSNRADGYQIWKIPVAGGHAQQITRNGGYEAYESPDGKDLYYAKPQGTEGIWRVPVQSGSEVQVIDHGRQVSWAMTDRGIALLDHLAKPRPKVEFFTFPPHQPDVGYLPSGVKLAPAPAPQFSLSRDGRWMVYVNYDLWGSDVHMLQGSW